MSMHVKWAGWAALLLAVSAGPILAQDDTETSAEKIRKALRQKADFDYNAQDFQDLADHLRGKTGLNIVLDPMVAQQMGGLGIRNIGGPGQNFPSIEFKGKGANLHQALQRLLTLHTLSYVVQEDSVLITFEEDAVCLQVGQRIHVKFEDVPLHKALKDLARSSGVNIIIDPRVKKEAQTSVSLDVENTSVENAVRLLAEFAGLKSVLSDNILLVTSEARADKMRSETPPVPKTPRNGPQAAAAFPPVPPAPLPPPQLMPGAPFAPAVPGPLGPVPPPQDPINPALPQPQPSPLPPPQQVVPIAPTPPAVPYIP